MCCPKGDSIVRREVMVKCWVEACRGNGACDKESMTLQGIKETQDQDVLYHKYYNLEKKNIVI